MKKIITKVILLLIMVASSIQSFAQSNSPEMADALRANGKIYVVVIVLSIVLIGIVIYLFALDKKISGIEKKLNQK